VVDVKIFSRKGVEKDDRARQIEEAELFMMEKNLKDEIRILQDERTSGSRTCSTARRPPPTS